MKIDHLSELEILNLKLKDLAKLSGPSFISKRINKIKRELTNKGLTFEVSYYFGTEWFCADGSIGIALPHYLLHPKLEKIEKKYLGYTEGILENDFLALFRHELGHAIDNAFQLKNLKTREQIFGPHSIPYPDSYLANPYSKKFVKHLKNNYAQAHPEEDWAETFAVWLTPKSNWQKKYATWPAIEKLKYMDKVLSQLKNTPSKIKGQRTPYNIKNDNRTLRQYILDTRKERRLNRRAFYTNKLPKSLKANQGFSFKSILQKNEFYIIQKVAFQTGQNRYRIKPMMNLFKMETKDCLISPKLKKQKALSLISKLIIKEQPRFLRQGRHRIKM